MAAAIISLTDVRADREVAQFMALYRALPRDEQRRLVRELKKMEAGEVTVEEACAAFQAGLPCA